MSDAPRAPFDHDTTAAQVVQGVDLTGKLALVTGASSGLGVETARALASAGARLVLAARNVPKLEGVAARIRASTGNEAVSVAELELDSLTSIRGFADAFLAQHEALHLLVNNAGVMASPFERTQDGLELQFGTNHIGHFLLTNLLVPALKRGAPARVVALSSRGHRISPVVFDDIQFEEREYDKWASYGQSKTANILFAVELDRRLRDEGIRAYAVHPGVIMTELSRHMTQDDFDMLEARGTRLRMKSVEQGAATSVYAATAPELEGKGGVYLEDCHIAEVEDDPEATEGVQPYALDAAAAERLWAVSEELVGESFLA